MIHPFTVKQSLHYDLTHVPNNIDCFIQIPLDSPGPGRVPIQDPPGHFYELTDTTKAVIRASYLVGIPILTHDTVEEFTYRLTILRALGLSPISIRTPEGPVLGTLEPGAVYSHLGLKTTARPLSNPEFDICARLAHHPPSGP